MLWGENTDHEWLPSVQLRHFSSSCAVQRSVKAGGCPVIVAHACSGRALAPQVRCPWFDSRRLPSISFSSMCRQNSVWSWPENPLHQERTYAEWFSQSKRLELLPHKENLEWCFEAKTEQKALSESCVLIWRGPDAKRRAWSHQHIYSICVHGCTRTVHVVTKYAFRNCASSCTGTHTALRVPMVSWEMTEKLLMYVTS